MRMRPAFAAFAFAAAAALAAPAATAPAPGRKASSAAVDWSRTVAVTPEGGVRKGNPNARVKIVEYASLTCPHCADFAKSASAPLNRAVLSGKVSFEYRPYVLNGIDAAATVLARCASPANFFRLVDSLFATQADWVQKVSGMSAAQKSQLNALPENARLGRIAEIGGMLPIAARAEVPAARARACLADPARLAKLGEMAEAAAALGVQGTPTFFINGSRVHAHDWTELEPLIRQAGG
jgi:protein-disulfide isomerase